MAQIKLKRGPSSNITSINLAKGEPAFTTDTKKLYIGNEDGTKTLINPDITPSVAPVTSVSGRTGDIILTGADVGLGNVNNTSDLAFGLIACIIGVATYFIGRQTAAKNEGEWRGELKSNMKHMQEGILRIELSLEKGAEETRESIQRVYARMDERFDEHVARYHSQGD